MPFSREAAHAKHENRVTSSQPGTGDCPTYHGTVVRTHWDGAVQERCFTCGAEVCYEVEQ